MPLALRPIGSNDFAVIDDGNPVGRIRYAAERTNNVWMWNVTLNIPGGVPSGTSAGLDRAKADFRTAWTAFKSAPQAR
jgi:hypothetical protein